MDELIIHSLDNYLKKRPVYVEKESCLEILNDEARLTNGFQEKRIKLCNVRRIVILGENKNIRFDTIYKISKHNIPIDILSSRYEPICQLLTGYTPKFNQFVNQQLFHDNPEETLKLAKYIIYTKIENSFFLLSKKISFFSEKVKTFLMQVNNCSSLDELRGIEGNAARYYFSYWGELIGKHFQWKGRNYHPARDPVNIMLSIGYNMLYQRICSTLVSYGVDPFAGIIHVGRGSHCALASDLQEPFRAFIDYTVLNLIRKRRIQQKMFRETGNCEFKFSDSIGFRTLVTAIEEMFNRDVILYSKYQENKGIKQSLNAHIDDSVLSYASFLTNNYSLKNIHAWRLVK